MEEKAREFDSLDKKIMESLGRDAEQSNESLAKQFGVSTATVRRRVKRLLDEKVMRVVAVFDPEKVGFPVTCIIGFNVTHRNLDKAIEHLSEWPDIKWISTTTGCYDIMAVARFQSTDALSRFVHKGLIKIQGLKATETFICLDIRKTRYIPLFSDYSTWG